MQCMQKSYKMVAKKWEMLVTLHVCKITAKNTYQICGFAFLLCGAYTWEKCKNNKSRLYVFNNSNNFISYFVHLGVEFNIFSTFRSLFSFTELLSRFLQYSLD